VALSSNFLLDFYFKIGFIFKSWELGRYRGRKNTFLEIHLQSDSAEVLKDRTGALL
jgi:hypothetical protein